MELPALGIALLVLTAALVVGVTVADSALGAAERSTLEHRTAVSVSERLVGAESGLTNRENVLQESAVPSLTGSNLLKYGLPADAGAVVHLDGRVIASNGTVDEGSTVERIVLIEHRSSDGIEPAFGGSNSVTLPRRTANTTLTIRPANATVQRVHANDRTVLENGSGLNGSFDVRLSQLETVTLQFEANRQLEEGDVRIEYYPVETHKATLEVTVDA